MHWTCFFCFSQISLIFSPMSGVPSVSFPLSPSKVFISFSIHSMISAVGRVLRRQWWAISFTTSLSDSTLFFFFSISFFFAFFKNSRSASSHTKMQAEKQDMNGPNSGWASVVIPRARRRIQCHGSNLTVIFGQAANISLMLPSPVLSSDELQQYLSVYITDGGSCLAEAYRCTNPFAMDCIPLPSFSVRTDMSFCPSSFPTFVTQSAVATASPARHGVKPPLTHSLKIYRYTVKTGEY